MFILVEMSLNSLFVKDGQIHALILIVMKHDFHDNIEEENGKKTDEADKNF